VCREKLGVVVKLGTRVSALRGDHDRIDAALTSGGEMRPTTTCWRSASARRRSRAPST
jgi:hypothetical protein